MGEGLEGSSTLDQGIKTFEKDAPFFSLTSIVKSLLEFFRFDFIDESLNQLHV